MIELRCDMCRKMAKTVKRTVKMQTNIMILSRGNCGREKRPTVEVPDVATTVRQATAVIWKQKSRLGNVRVGHTCTRGLESGGGNL